MSSCGFSCALMIVTVDGGQSWTTVYQVVKLTILDSHRHNHVSDVNGGGDGG